MRWLSVHRRRPGVDSDPLGGWHESFSDWDAILAEVVTVVIAVTLVDIFTSRSWWATGLATAAAVVGVQFTYTRLVVPLRDRWF